MSDFYSTIAPENITKADAQQVAEKIIRHLVARKIILPNQTDCTLDTEGGYPPGENHSQAVDSSNQSIFDLKVNGLAVNIGRQVFHADELNTIKCKNCGENVLEEADWGEALEAWYDGTGKDILDCPRCHQAKSIISYDFEPVWVFGELGFTFWNWGILKHVFIKEMEGLTGGPVKIFYGKI